MMELVARLVLAGLGGLAVYASYEPLGFWVAGIVGVALLLVALAPYKQHGVSVKAGMLIASTHTLVAYLLLLPWIGEFVGIFPYVALCVFLSLYSLVLGAVGARMLRWRRFGLLCFCFVYVAVEWARSSFPFGGFSWVRLAWGQINGVLAAFVPYGGVAVVTFLAVMVAAVAVALLHPEYRRWRWHYAPLGVAALVGGTVLSLLSPSYAVPVQPGTTDTDAQAADNAHAPVRNDDGHTTGEVRVAAVQGNVPRLGLEFNAQQFAVLRNHVQETLKIDEPIDFAIWPENAADKSPFTDTQAAGLVNEAVAHVNAPILVGTVTQAADGPRNTMAVFDPTSGATEQHDKKFLQPFGEYMPWRDFFRMFSSMVDYAGNFTPGDGTGVVHVNAAGLQRQVALGVSTCYEVAFDASGRDAVENGAEIMTTPTNNATFGFSDMTYQQLAMSRMRAKELDRSYVVAATSGVSAIVLPDGTVESHTEIFEPNHLVASLPLRNTVTFSVRYGQYIEWVMIAMGAIFALIAVWRPLPQGAGSAYSRGSGKGAGRGGAQSKNKGKNKGKNAAKRSSTRGSGKNGTKQAGRKQK